MRERQLAATHDDHFADRELHYHFAGGRLGVRER
jgi:hypothetical protein